MTKKTFVMTLCCLICTSVIAHTDTENDNMSIVNEVCSDVNIEHESVDLGLPSGLRWATMNIGASTATDYGDYFAWGEVAVKKTFKSDYSNYKHYKKDSVDGVNNTDGTGGFTKYVRPSDASKYGYNFYCDKRNSLELEDDVAHEKWGKEWRMPTDLEWKELCNYCTWEWVSIDGVNGYKVIGCNGRWIFLPASGYRSNNSLIKAGSIGLYWANELYESGSNYARYLIFHYSSDIMTGGYNRCRGLAVRPVRICK